MLLINAYLLKLNLYNIRISDIDVCYICLLENKASLQIAVNLFAIGGYPSILVTILPNFHCVKTQLDRHLQQNVQSQYINHQSILSDVSK